MCNQRQATSILSEVYTSCNPILGDTTKSAYLYGSYARGDYHEGSDIDILSTVDLEAEDISAFRSSIAVVAGELSLKHDVAVSVTVKPYAQFLRYTNVLPYYQNVIRERVPYAS